jgi:peptidyl-prolyl cis-trans isomerase D
MMMQLRKNVTKIVMVMMFSLLILSFAVWGIGDIFRGGSRIEAVAEVGDIAIDQRTFSRQLTLEVNRLENRFNSQLDGEQIRALGIPGQVLRQMIVGALLDEKVAKMGLVVSEDQVKRRIVSEPAFQGETGAFDPSRFTQVLRISGVSEDQYVSQLRQDIARGQLGRVATSGVNVSRHFLDAFYTYREERRIAETIPVPSGDGADLPEPDDAQLKEVHEAFADSFESPEYRAVTLIELSPDDLLDEIAVSEEELEAEFEARRAEFAEPERRSIEQLVFDSASEARVFKSALDGGQNFTEAADGLLGRAPVVLTEVSQDAMALQFPELAAAVFATAKDGHGGPSESPFGWHVFRVTAIEPALNPTLADVRDDLKEEIARRSAIDSIISIANQLDDEIAGGASLEEAAGQLGLKLRMLPALDRLGQDKSGETITLPTPGQLLPDIFAAATGDESLLSETPDGIYFMFRVDGVTPAAIRPLGEVRAAVLDVWRAQEARAQARIRADGLAERVRLGEKMPDVAETANLSVDTTAPIDRFGSEPSAVQMPDLTTRLFELAMGEVVVAEAPEGWVIARLIDIMPGDPSSAPEAIEALDAALAEGLQNDLLTAFTGELERTLGVRINQTALDNVLSAY